MREGIGSKAPTLSQPDGTCCGVVELRQYTLHPGRRDELITLFDARLIEGQEALGMTVIGQFRDLDDPDRFVWLRGFADMGARAEGLAGFYGGPIWQEHRDAANATMVDSDNVLLLRPAKAGSGFDLSHRQDPAGAMAAEAEARIAATIYYFDEPVDRVVIDYFEDTVIPILKSKGAVLLASFVSERQANNFPRLPVREGENVFAWFARFENRGVDFGNVVGDGTKFATVIGRRIKGPPEVHRLVPTSRSRIRA